MNKAELNIIIFIVQILFLLGFILAVVDLFFTGIWSFLFFIFAIALFFK